jgi:hypothetical protein
MQILGNICWLPFHIYLQTGYFTDELQYSKINILNDQEQPFNYRINASQSSMSVIVGSS